MAGKKSLFHGTRLLRKAVIFLDGLHHFRRNGGYLLKIITSLLSHEWILRHNRCELFKLRRIVCMDIRLKEWHPFDQVRGLQTFG